MIDLENEMVNNLIEDIKGKIEIEILNCFDCSVNVLYAGELKDGKYTINITYMTKEDAVHFPQGACMTTNIEIFEEDYKKWCKEVKE